MVRSIYVLGLSIVQDAHILGNHTTNNQMFRVPTVPTHTYVPLVCFPMLRAALPTADHFSAFRTSVQNVSLYLTGTCTKGLSAINSDRAEKTFLFLGGSWMD